MRARLATLAVAAACALTPTALHAAPPERHPDPRAAARALAERGEALYEAGKYDEAIDAFTRADGAYHAPTLALALARALTGARKLLEARARLQSVIDEPLAAGSPLAFRDAQRTAKEELAALQKRIPSLRIVVRGGGGKPFAVTLDGAEVAGWSPDRPAPANPGAHLVTATPLGEPGVSRTVELAEGAELRIDIDLPSTATAPAARRWLGASLTSFGVGVLGLALGIGAGVSALNSGSAIRQDCGGSVCLPSEQDKLSSARGVAAASTFGFVLAGAGAVAGVVLLLEPWSKPTAVGEAHRPPAQPVGIVIGPASLGVKGAF